MTSPPPPSSREAYFDDAWFDERWRSLSDDQRRRAVELVRSAVSDEDGEKIRAKHAAHGRDWIHHLIDLDPETQDDMFSTGFAGAGQTTFSAHHGFGTALRNLLRSGTDDVAGIPDKELPPAPYEDGSPVRNWDDFYVQAIEAALGLRD